jgi:translocation and assembly module TamB
MTVSGTIDAIALNADGRAGTAQFTASARLTPFAAVALDTLSSTRGSSTLPSGTSLPVTRLSLKAEARPDAGGLAGRFDAANAIAGPIDKELPVRSLAARFAWHADALTLDDVVAKLAGGGRAAGRANIPLNGDAGKWTLDVRDVDLRQVYTPLAPTRLSGTLGADLAAANQRIDGSVADRTIVGGIGVSFAATVAERKLVVEHFQIRAGTGELAGSGRAEFNGRRAFEVTAKAKHVDPSRFGKFPAGRSTATSQRAASSNPHGASQRR